MTSSHPDNEGRERQTPDNSGDDALDDIPTTRMRKGVSPSQEPESDRESDPDGVLKPFFPTPRAPFPGVNQGD
ncbi:MAG: hypothetical protein JJU11_05005 [Candidatus Sumerlaeia bacterium]|nr:hypothetical protein [Candidatus Sumerlaeia bacterium]